MPALFAATALTDAAAATAVDVGATAAASAGATAAASVATTAAASAGAAAAGASILPSFATILGGVSALSTAGQVMGTLQQGRAANAYGNYQQQIDTIKGKEDLAAGSAEAAQQATGLKYALSNAEAVAGASGGTPTDTTVQNQEKQLVGQGTFNQLMAVFNGQAKQQGETEAGQAAVYQGQQAQTGSTYKAVGSLAQGGQSLYQKYG